MLLNHQSSIIYENKVYDVNHLAEMINPICQALDNLNHQNLRVGIYLDSRLGQLCSILAVIAVKGIYIPISPSEPLERVQKITSQYCDVVITDRDIDTGVPVMEYSTLKNSTSNYITENLEFMPHYIIFTSGSTGEPKGVEVESHAINNFVEAISEMIDYTPGKKIACFTTVSFDIYFLESIMALYKGLTVVLANQEEQRNPKLMAKLIQDQAVDMVQMTPSGMQLLINQDKELTCLNGVTEIMIGGEMFSQNLLDTLQKTTSARIYNMYGPTETTIWSTVSELTHKDRIDIGYPIKNTEVYLLDSNLLILEHGKTGEICISGKGLAKGYVNSDELTAKKFVRLPQKLDTIVYRTGDQGRYLPDGSLECLGRMDNQVKIRGHRIELEEIEAHLNQMEGIQQSIVSVDESKEGNKILEAYYTSEKSIDQKKISSRLFTELPDYMVPVVYKRVKSFLMTGNGKIDRKRVSQAELVSDENSSDIVATEEALSDSKQKILDVILSCIDLNKNEVSLQSKLEAAKVDSVSFIKLVIALEKSFAFQFDNEMLLMNESLTFQSLIDYVEKKATRIG